MLEYLLYRLVMTLSRYTPLRLAYWVALRIADLHYHFDHKARMAVEKNLRHILGPERNDAILDNEVRWTFRQFGKYMAEFFRFTRFDSRYVARYVMLSGTESLKDAYDKGRGLIMVTAHIGNWELGACCLNDMGYKVTSVALEAKNTRVDRLLYQQRTKRGVDVMPVGSFLRGCYRALRDGRIVALLGDRDLTNSGIKIKFFGRDVSFPQGPARISLRTRAPIIPTFFLRRPNDCWQMNFGEPIYPESQDDSEEAVRAIMEKYVAVMEETIREHPSQWAMFHDIWDGASS